MTKTSFKHIIAIICLVVPTLFTSCTVKEDNPVESPESGEQPTEDALEVMAKTRTYVFHANYTGTGSALVNRLTNTTNILDETVQAAIIHDGCIPSLVNKDYEDIIALIARGGCIIYCSATESNVDAFIRGLQRIGGDIRNTLTFTEDGWAAFDKIMYMSENSSGLMFPPGLLQNDTNGVLCDIFAFRGYDQYVVADTEEQPAINTVTTEVGEDGEETVIDENVIFPPNDEPSDYICGLHADGLANWMDTEKDKAAEWARGNALMSRAAENGDFMDLDKVSNAHTQQFSFTAQGAYKKAPVTVLYEIWPVNNTKGTDFYLVHQSIGIRNSKLKCGPVKEYSWDTNQTEQYYGWYMRAYHAYMAYVRNEIKFKGGTAHLDHVSPHNAIGSSSFSETSGWSLSTSFINPNLSGAVSMSKTYVYNVADLKLKLIESNIRGAIQWEYEETSKPKFKKTWLYHGQCKDIQKNDVRFDYCWIWRVDNADRQYSFEGKTTVDMEGLWNYHELTNHGYKRFSNSATHNVTLPQPPRYAQQWKMDMLPINKSAWSWMESQLSNYWKSEFDLYTITKDDRTEIDKWIDKVTIAVNANPVTVRTAFSKESLSTDTIKFSLFWKPETESANYAKRDFLFLP